MLLLEFVNLFFAGILGGIEIALHYGLPAGVRALEEKEHLPFRRAMVRRLRVLVPAFFLPAAVSGIALATLERGAPGAGLRWTAVGALLAWVAIRVVGTVPINSAMLDWPPDAPPDDWKAQIDRAERFHVVGVWAAITAFVCFLAAVALRVGAD